MCIGFVLLASLTITSVVCAQQPEKVDAKKVEAKLKGIWQERSADPKVKMYDKTWEIFTHAPGRARWTDHDNESQTRDHQVHLNVGADPMWFDIRFREGPREWVVVGIVKISGEQILWSSSKWVDAADYDKANGLVAGRPKDFSPQAGHSVVLERIKP